MSAAAIARLPKPRKAPEPPVIPQTGHTRLPRGVMQLQRDGKIMPGCQILFLLLIADQADSWRRKYSQPITPESFALFAQLDSVRGAELVIDDALAAGLVERSPEDGDRYRLAPEKWGEVPKWLDRRRPKPAPAEEPGEEPGEEPQDGEAEAEETAQPVPEMKVFAQPLVLKPGRKAKPAPIPGYDLKLSLVSDSRIDLLADAVLRNNHLVLSLSSKLAHLTLVPKPDPKPEGGESVKCTSDGAPQVPLESTPPSGDSATPAKFTRWAVEAGMRSLDNFDRFLEVAGAAGVDIDVPDDRSAAYAQWRQLTPAERGAATRGYEERIAAGVSPSDDSALAALPQNYLKRQLWLRKIRPVKPSASHKGVERLRELKAFLGSKSS